MNKGRHSPLSAMLCSFSRQRGEMELGDESADSCKREDDGAEKTR